MIKRLLTATFFLLLFHGHALANQPGGHPDGLVTLNDAGTGVLLIKSTVPGKYVPAPLLATDVQMQVTGTINRTIVTQKFTNPSDQWIEATYAFPLPEGGAVDTLKMVVGDRIIEGVIKEKEDARKTYEAAKQAGQKASLIEQVRPNMFTNDVANIGPHETIIVQIEYQEAVRISDNKWSLRFPMVIGARYNPAAPKGDTRHQIKDPVPQREKIPGLQAYDKDRVNPLTLRVALNAGMKLQFIETPHHRTTVSDGEEGQYVIELATDTTPANRDFELVWAPRAGEEPTITAYREQVGDDHYTLMTIVPPAMDQVARTNRELVLVIDVSGSMSGTSIAQARASALYALDRLGPDDKINVITFSHETHVLFASAQHVTPDIRRQAHAYISALTTNGGTEMLPALQAALVTTNARPGDMLRQVVFMTDGSVGNEDQLFSLIHDHLGDSRLFTVGIGSAPNSHFMTRAANMGRGTFTFIDATSQVEPRMQALFHKLESPAMTDITLAWRGSGQVSMAQDMVSDLYAGDPIVIVARHEKPGGALAISGQRGTSEWTDQINLSGALPGKGIGKLWARHKIADLERARFRGGDHEEAKQQITALALDHHLVSRFTSLVAVDTTPSRDADTPLTHRDIPLMIPADWTMFDTPGEVAQPAPSPQLMAQIQPMGSRTAPMALPQTATGLQFSLLFGVLLLLIGVMIASPRRIFG